MGKDVKDHRRPLLVIPANIPSFPQATVIPADAGMTGCLRE